MDYCGNPRCFKREQTHTIHKCRCSDDIQHAFSNIVGNGVESLTDYIASRGH